MHRLPRMIIPLLSALSHRHGRMTTCAAMSAAASGLHSSASFQVVGGIARRDHGRANIIEGGGGHGRTRGRRMIWGGSINRPVIAITSTHLSVERRGASAFASTSSEEDDVEGTKKPIPIVLLAGFLGSGKTSTLKHLLENNVNVRIGTIVNDVAEVNIDAKLISNVLGGTSAAASPGNGYPHDEDGMNYADGGIVELQNGCACCSLADELLTSVVKLTDGGKRRLDAIVVELSGVADPMSVRDNWEQARLQGHPATRLASLERTVTLVDACTFGTDWLSWDEAGDRREWREDGGGGNNAFHPSSRKVPELLAEQVEAADLLLVNKVDMADDGQVAVASGVARGLLKEGSRGNVLEVSYGRVSVAELLGKDIMGVAVEEEEEEEEVGEEEAGHSHGHGNHDDASSTCVEPGCTDASHSHGHSSSSTARESGSSACDDPVRTDPAHSHSHGHEHSAAANSAEGGTTCDDSVCTDPTHSHSHGHEHAATASSAEGGATCDGPVCTDPTHSHSHGHEHAAAASCAEEGTTCDDPVCTDPTHSHSHEHAHATSTEVSMNHLGISSFVYRASVPFNSQRLLALLNQWPVPIKDELDIGLVVGLGNKEGNLDDETPEDKRAFVGVLRSKGFCWMAPTYWSNARGGPGEDVWRHDTAMYWSHAGKHFGISTAGKWWASLGMEGMRPFFSNNMGEYDRILREDWASEEWGDRRQELVFIGTRLDEDTIRSALNSCLCTEEEMVDYRARLRKYLDANPSTISR